MTPGDEDDQRFRWSGVVWWACEDLNLVPLPYQQNAGNRCAEACFRRSRGTVEAEVKCSIGVQLSVLPSGSSHARADHALAHLMPCPAPSPIYVRKPCYIGAHQHPTRRSNLNHSAAGTSPTRDRRRLISGRRDVPITVWRLNDRDDDQPATEPGAAFASRLAKRLVTGDDLVWGPLRNLGLDAEVATTASPASTTSVGRAVSPANSKPSPASGS